MHPQLARFHLPNTVVHACEGFPSSFDRMYQGNVEQFLGFCHVPYNLMPCSRIRGHAVHQRSRCMGLAQRMRISETPTHHIVVLMGNYVSQGSVFLRQFVWLTALFLCRLNGYFLLIFIIVVLFIVPKCWSCLIIQHLNIVTSIGSLKNGIWVFW